MSEPVVVIERVPRASDEIAAAIAGLLPQLTDRPPDFGRAELDRIVSSPASALLIARLPDRRAVGMLTLACYPVPTGLHAIIEDVVVDRAARGHGIGEALVTQALTLAREAGAGQVDLTSSPSREAANRLYLRLGFEQRETNVYRYRL